MYFFILILWWNTMTSRIKTDVFFNFTDFQHECQDESKRRSRGGVAQNSNEKGKHSKKSGTKRATQRQACTKGDEYSGAGESGDAGVGVNRCEPVLGCTRMKGVGGDAFESGFWWCSATG